MRRYTIECPVCHRVDDLVNVSGNFVPPSTWRTSSITLGSIGKKLIEVCSYKCGCLFMIDELHRIVKAGIPGGRFDELREDMTLEDKVLLID